MKVKICGLIRSAEAFAEKGQQVSPNKLYAFGITICSRYGNAGEIVEMFRFSHASALAAVAHYVKEVFYDSKAGVCSFDLDESVVEGSEFEREIFSIAKCTISSFVWFGDYHSIDDPPELEND